MASFNNLFLGDVDVGPDLLPFCSQVTGLTFDVLMEM
jgi:hypothetical protein